MTTAKRALFQSFLPTQDRPDAYVWKYSQAIGGRRPRHFHSEPEMNLVVAGSATFGIGDDVVEASVGDLLAFPPGQDHALLEASPDLYLYAVGMDWVFSSEVLRADRHGVALPLHVQLTSTDFETLARSAADLVDRTGVEQHAAEFWQHAHWLRRKASSASGAPMHVSTRRTLELLDEDATLGLEALAQQARTLPSEVSRYFHRDLGIPLVRYRARLRLMRFVRLVDAGAHNLMTSASEAGFGSYSQCHRVFQSELGCAPREFFALGGRDRMQAAYIS